MMIFNFRAVRRNQVILIRAALFDLSMAISAIEIIVQLLRQDNPPSQGGLVYIPERP